MKVLCSILLMCSLTNMAFSFAITNMTMDSISWSPPQGGNYGSIEWKDKLTDEEWQLVAICTNTTFVHNNPEGFYRVSDSASKYGIAIFPIWNSGTAPLQWYAEVTSGDCELITSSGIVVDENDSNILIARPSGTNDVIITIHAGNVGVDFNQSQQVTIEII